MTGPSYPSGHATELLGYKIFSKKAFRGAKKKSCTIFSSSTDLGLLMANDGVLEARHQRELVFGHLAEVRGSSVQVKQTVCRNDM